MFNSNSNFNFFCPRTCTYIGADIDTSQIKLVEISRKNGQFRIENYAIYPYHSESQEWRQRLTANLFFNAREIFTAVPDTQILSKRVTVGKKLSEKERVEYLSTEMEKTALCPMNELAMDFCATDIPLNSESRNTIEIIGVAVRRQTIESLKQLFQGTLFHIKKIGLMSQIEEIHEKQKVIIHDMALNSRISQEKWDKDRSVLMQACQFALYLPYNNSVFNFLPWRKIQQKQRQKLSIIGLMSGIIIAGLTYFVLDSFFEKPPVNISKNNPKKIPLSVVTSTKKSPKIQKNLGDVLKNTPIQHFKMVGFMEKENETNRGKKNIWGIIQAPNGQIFPITIGDAVGKEQAYVILITEKKIVLNHHHINKFTRRYIIE